MPEKLTTPLSTEVLKRLPITEEALVSLWSQLSDAHQATVMLALNQIISDAPANALVLQSFQERSAPTIDAIPSTFGLVSLRREDLLQVGFSAETVEQLDDDDLTTIATRVCHHFQTDGFWEELKYQAVDYLDAKAHQNIRRPESF